MNCSSKCSRYLVGALVEKVSGTAFPTFLRDEIALPLGIEGECMVGVTDVETLVQHCCILLCFAVFCCILLCFAVFCPSSRHRERVHGWGDGLGNIGTIPPSYHHCITTVTPQ
jgi:hypothetical protein